MRLLTTIISGNMLDTAKVLLNKSLVWRTMILGVPLIVLALFLAFWLTCDEIHALIAASIARNEQMHAEAIAKNFEEKLVETSNELKVLAAGSTEKQEMIKRIILRNINANLAYREIAYISNVSDERYILLNIDKKIIDVPATTYSKAQNSPFQTLSSEIKQGQVKISSPVEVTYNMLRSDSELKDITLQVIRFFTTIYDAQGKLDGILMLSLDLKIFRNILTKNSIINTDLDEDEENENKDYIRSMFFDYYGWILFQSEDPYKKEYENLPLSFDIVRSGLKGDLSKPDFKSAFRPAVQYDNYHKMVELIRSGRSGHFDLPKGDEGWSSNQANAECISFAPVKFQASNENSPEIIGGIALLDTTFLVSHTYNSILKLFLTCFFMTSVLLSACLWWIGRYTKRCILSLNQALLDRNQTLSTDPLKLPNLPTEVQQLQENTNILLQRLIQAKTDQASYLASHKVKKQNEPLEQLPDPEELKQHLLVGNSPPIVALRNKINTVAKVDGDVLITGETGTGKELVSQAIHAASDRADKPFISINCGALDESLLMDTLFGHVKGAFTEARQNRKGAFIAADGGTLLLDEIGNATPKVQQALLRALSIRKVRPLGSDHDLDFSTRIIAATNADLRNDGKDGGFRNDLYFRLSVFSIHTTPLRECKQDILPLIVHFIYNLISTKAPGMPKKMPVITRGALEKLQEYDWPGNMRELKNIITRAVAFCQNDILLASDILFDEYEPDEPTQSEDINTNKIKLPDFNEILSKLNYRQQSIFPIILKQGSITRNEYQKLAGDNISMRTAQYDLQEMISLGLIRKEGRGPAMRYMVDCSNYKDVINF